MPAQMKAAVRGAESAAARTPAGYRVPKTARVRGPVAAWAAREAARGFAAAGGILGRRRYSKAGERATSPARARYDSWKERSLSTPGHTRHWKRRAAPRPVAASGGRPASRARAE